LSFAWSLWVVLLELELREAEAFDAALFSQRLFSLKIHQTEKFGGFFVGDG